MALQMLQAGKGPRAALALIGLAAHRSSPMMWCDVESRRPIRCRGGRARLRHRFHTATVRLLQIRGDEMYDLLGYRSRDFDFSITLELHYRRLSQVLGGVLVSPICQYLGSSPIWRSRKVENDSPKRSMIPSAFVMHLRQNPVVGRRN